jgi:hypothetical protein
VQNSQKVANAHPEYCSEYFHDLLTRLNAIFSNKDTFYPKYDIWIFLMEWLFEVNCERLREAGGEKVKVPQAITLGISSSCSGLHASISLGND